MDKEKELLEQYKVSLYTFEPDQWSGHGFYDSDTRTIFLNSSLSSDERHRVLLHELGHLEHIGSIYRHSAMSCENQANRFMIRHLISEELTQYEVSEFNWLQFAERHKISTTWGEDMIQEEFYRLTGS